MFNNGMQGSLIKRLCQIKNTRTTPNNFLDPLVTQTYSYDLNGNVNQVVDSTAAMTVNYTYDNLNRLSTAATTSTAWGLSFTYDDFGNRTAQSVTKGSAPTSSLSISTANNRILTSGFSYDNNGNLTAMPGSTLTYDIENRITQVTGSFGTDQYKYGPDNTRLYKYRVNGYLPNEFYYFYGAFGELLGVYSPYDDGYSHGYRTIGLNTYFAGKQIRSKQTDNGTLSDAAVVVDRLGSVRKRVNVYTVTPTVNQTYLNYPFGEDQGSSANNREKYATYFRDKDTGLDYARNRYYASTIGRFLTPDPYGGSAKPGNPQSWNRYAYAGNDPTNRSDPSGLDSACYWTGEGIVCSFPTTFEFTSDGYNYIFQLVSAYYAGPPSGGGPNAPTNSTTPQPPNPCSYSADAYGPQVYQALGYVARYSWLAGPVIPVVGPFVGPTVNVALAISFKQKGPLDAQKNAGDLVTDYANYAYGVYTSAAGIPLTVALEAANAFGALTSSYTDRPVLFDKKYTALPVQNVENIKKGYNDQQNGTLCTPQSK